MTKSRHLPRKARPTFAVIGDGECEFWYFQMLKRNERSLRIDLKPEIPQKKRLSEQFERVIQYSKDYYKVFWIVDFDSIMIESRRARKGQKSVLQKFKEYYIDLQKNHKNVTVIINNPCLEFWILLHFEETAKYFNNCQGATKQLQKHLPGYEKTEKYYTRQNHDIYKKLKPNIHTAIKHAKKLDKFNPDDPCAAMTQMHIIFETAEIKQVLKASNAK